MDENLWNETNGSPTIRPAKAVRAQAYNTVRAGGVGRIQKGLLPLPNGALPNIGLDASEKVFPRPWNPRPEEDTTGFKLQVLSIRRIPNAEC